LGFDLKDLIAKKKIAIDFVYVERDDISQAGEYNLDALFIRLGLAIDSIGAKRVVLDTIESLFSSLPNPALLRSELRRLFRWLKEKGVTAIITAESGVDTISRQGLEEYVSDCVIVLDNRIEDQISSRRLRIVKYRGALHGSNEYPFLIDEDGISLIPITAASLNYEASNSRISSGIPRLDAMLGNKGFFRGSTILISGTAGTGKTSFLAHFAVAGCRRNERVLYCAFEESPDQIIRNMKSIGLDIQHWIEKGLLKIISTRPSQFGLDMHLIMVQKAVLSFKPHIVILDPVTSFADFTAKGKDNYPRVKQILMKLVDFLKSRQVTAMFSSLTSSGSLAETTHVAISSLIDSWILLRDIENNGERNRGLYVLKSRGMGHSNQVREFLITDKGVELVDVYVGANGVLMGGARLSMAAEEKALDLKLIQEGELRTIELENKRKAMEAKIAAIRAEFNVQKAAQLTSISQAGMRLHEKSQDRQQMGAIRNADVPIGRLKNLRRKK
ncbi:MAG: circadian clock protein KaiC, partial [Pseudomonadota bacterium]